MLIATLLVSCGGGGKDASKLANEVCDCYKKANSLPVSDPNRPTAQADCVKKQGANWDKIKDDQKKSDEFNKIIGDCGKEQIQNSMPK